MIDKQITYDLVLVAHTYILYQIMKNEKLPVLKETFYKCKKTPMSGGHFYYNSNFSTASINDVISSTV